MYNFVHNNFIIKTKYVSKLWEKFPNALLNLLNNFKDLISWFFFNEFKLLFYKQFIYLYIITYMGLLS